MTELVFVNAVGRQVAQVAGNQGRVRTHGQQPARALSQRVATALRADAMHDKERAALPERGVADDCRGGGCRGTFTPGHRYSIRSQNLRPFGTFGNTSWPSKNV